MKGKLVVAEGLDGAGKTTALHQILMKKEGFVYSKGFSNRSRWEKFIQKYNSSFLYYVDFIIKNLLNRKMLKQGKIILQDRYIQTVDTYLPDARWLHNRIFRFLLSPFFRKPDLFILFKVSVKECLKRLKKKEHEPDNYHEKLIKNPSLLLGREKEYLKAFQKLNCPKYIIDTSNKKVKDCEKILLEILRREKIC